MAEPESTSAPEKLRQWRAMRGLTQTQVAKDLLAVEQSTYSDYESGKKYPQLPIANLIERVTDGAVTAASWGIERRATKKKTGTDEG